MDQLPTTSPAGGQTAGTFTQVDPLDPMQSALGDLIDQNTSVRGMHPAAVPYFSLGVRERDFRIRQLEKDNRRLQDKCEKIASELTEKNIELAGLAARHGFNKPLTIFKVMATLIGGVVVAVGVEFYKVPATTQSGLLLMLLGVAIVAIAEIVLLWWGVKK